MTTRDSDAIQIRKWAASGDVATPESVGLNRATGWPLSYSQRGGDVLNRHVWNQIFREITALAHEVNTKGGILPWDDGIAYDHPALVMGSDNKVYMSVQDSTNRNPTTDTSDTYWAEFLTDTPDTSDYLPQLPYSGSRNDWNDLNETIMPAGAHAAYIIVDSTLVHNRPYSFSGGALVFLYRRTLGTTPSLIQEAYPFHTGDERAGIDSYRRVRDSSGTWGAWGAYPTLASAYVSGTADDDQVLETNSNIDSFVDNDVGTFTFVTLADYTAHRPAVLLTARDGGTGNARNAQVTTFVVGTVGVAVYDANGALADPFALSLAMLDPSGKP